MKHDLVLIATFRNDIDAEMAKSHIESAGIEALVVKDDAGGMLPSLQDTEGVRLMVGRSDAENARKVLEEKNLI